MRALALLGAVLVLLAVPAQAAASTASLWHRTIVNSGPSASGYTVAWSPYFAPSRNHRWQINLTARNLDYRNFPADCRASVIAYGIHRVIRIMATNYDAPNSDVYDHGTAVAVFRHWGKVRLRVAVWSARYFGPEASVCKALTRTDRS